MSSTTADGPPDPEQTRRLVLDGSEGTVQRARDFSRRALLDWQWLPAAGAEQQAVAEDVLLMVSELVTNACLHAPGGPRELRLYWNGVRLLVEVADTSPVPPRLHPHADPGRPGGHGLRIVDRLARAWGSVPQNGGKLVWLEVPSPLTQPRGRDHQASDPSVAT
ncbi:signal transduction histidine kinase [Kitasatospora sp. MAA19]|uniref:ATP-binding protein n=1 Tax=unclassified Kitasatospora TaxID=2633591 RepID=UPI002473F679|nr:ATP-binding protein [Kitasatospora sp. MAA19]MDH6708234.1 signal transduction histidine kinase [Kitasatospora sp. MAA19]